MKYSKFLENYRLYTQGNETPELMHLWAGLSTLAGAIEKRRWVDQNFFKIYLNLYIVLIGPPGVVSKSTCMGLGEKMLLQTGAVTLGDSVLKEKIIQEMQEKEQSYQHGTKLFRHCSVTYISDELNVLLSSGVDMVKFLVTMFSKENKFEYKTKNSGVFELHHPFLNLIAAAVPEWFGTGVAADMASTGFLARCIIVFEDECRGSFPIPIITPEQERAKEECLRIMEKLKNSFGPVPFTKKGKDFYIEWYNEQQTKKHEDYRMLGYYNRKSKTHVPKVAALMALGDEREEISVNDLEMAIEILGKTEKKMRSAYLIAGGNRLAPFISRIITMLDENDGVIPAIEVVRSFYSDLNMDEIRQLFEQLYEMGVAKKLEDKNTKTMYLKRI